MKLNQSSMQQRTSNYEQRLHRPKPPTAQMIERAQPFRADVVQAMEATIKDPSYRINE